MTAKMLRMLVVLYVLPLASFAQETRIFGSFGEAMEQGLKREAASARVYKGGFKVLIHPYRPTPDADYQPSDAIIQAFVGNGWARCEGDECPKAEVFCEVVWGVMSSSSASAEKPWRVDTEITCSPDRVGDIFIRLRTFYLVGHFRTADEKRKLFNSDHSGVSQKAFEMARAALRAARALEKP